MCIIGCTITSKAKINAFWKKIFAGGGGPFIAAPFSEFKTGSGFEKAGFGFRFSKTRLTGFGFGFSKMYQIGDFCMKKTPNWHFLVKKKPNFMGIRQIGAFLVHKWDYEFFLVNSWIFFPIIGMVLQYLIYGYFFW